MKHTLSAFALLMAMAVSCNKEDNVGGSSGGNNSNLTPIEKMLVGKWQLTSRIVVNFQMSGNDTQNILEPCEADDVYTFADDMKYIVADESSTCSSAEGYNTSWPWDVTADSSFEFTHGPGRYTPKIYHLDANTFKIRASRSNSSSGYATYTRK